MTEGIKQSDRVLLMCADRRTRDQRLVYFRQVLGSHVENVTTTTQPLPFGAVRMWQATLYLRPLAAPKAQHPDIARVELPSARGWLVVVRYGGHSREQFFDDNEYGGREGSLVAAEGWRDAQVRAIDSGDDETIALAGL